MESVQATTSAMDQSAGTPVTRALDPPASQPEQSLAERVVDLLDEVIRQLGNPRTVANALETSDDEAIHSRFGEFIDWFCVVTEPLSGVEHRYSREDWEAGDDD